LEIGNLFIRGAPRRAADATDPHLGTPKLLLVRPAFGVKPRPVWERAHRSQNSGVVHLDCYLQELQFLARVLRPPLAT
jgi:hypothetical protein